MKVKIGDRIYDSNEQPIMLILDEIDKKNISEMNKDATKFISYPDDEEFTEKMIKNFMKL